MSSSIINWVIDKYLSNILEINKEETKSSLWSGEFEMSNLKIKPEIFSSMNLPYFELVHGYVGNMKIKMSLPRFYANPIKVEIDKVFFHAKQKKLENIKKEVEIVNMENYKDSLLQSAEEFSNQIDTLKGETTPGMTNLIINNLEIEIKDICIRFDDEISYNLIPFSFGILLKSLKIKTVDENFEEAEGIEYKEVNNKILKMSKLSMYLDTFENEGKLIQYHEQIDKSNELTEVTDEKIKNYLGPLIEYYRYCLTEMNVNLNKAESHQYLAYNLGFLLKLSMNDNLKNGKPQYEADCQLDNIILSISLVQIKSAMKLLAYQDLNSKYQIGLAKEYYVKVISEDEKMNYIENYISYYNYKYGLQKNEKQAENIKASLKQVENQLKYEVIQNMREAAKYKLSHDSKIDEIDKKIQELKGGSGFMSYFRSGPSAEDQKKISELENQKRLLIEENIDENVKARLKADNPEKVEVDKMAGLPDEFVLYKLRLHLPEFVFNINSQGLEKMLTNSFKDFTVKASIQKKGQFFSLFIGDISVTQYQLQDTVYKTLVSTVRQKNDENQSDEKKKENQGACYIEFHNDPNHQNTNFYFKFRNQKRLIITINLYSIQYIINKVMSSLATTISKFGSERYVGSGEIQNLIKSGFDTNYIMGGFQHFNIDLDIIIKGPIIIYPQDLMDEYNKKCLLIRLGDLDVKSILPPRQELNINYVELQDRSKLFDIYAASLKNFCMSTLDDFNGDLSELARINGLNLVDNINISFTFESMFESKNKNYEKMKIGLTFGKCRFNLRDSQIVFFIELLENMQKSNKKLEFALENKTKLEEDEERQLKEDEEKEKKEKKEKEEKEKKEKDKKDKINSLIKGIKEEKEKKIAEKKKEENVNNNLDRDSNYLIFNFVLENIELCLMKSLYKSEREILSKVKLPPEFDKEYREFIIFQLNRFTIEYLTTEKGIMKVDLSILSTGIRDEETFITDGSNPSGDTLVNKEFQGMISMNSDNKIIGLGSYDQSRMFSRGSSNYGNANSVLIEQEEKPRDQLAPTKFLVVNYVSDPKTNMQNIDVILQKIHICFSMSTMARLYQYYNYYFGMYSKSCENIILELAKMERDHKKLKLQNKLSKALSSDISSLSDVSSTMSDLGENNDIEADLNEDTEKKKIFGKDLINSLKADLASKNNDIIDTSSKNKKDEEIAKVVEQEMKEKENELSQKLTIKNNKSKMKIKVEMKETALVFPLDDTSSKTKLLRFRFNFTSTILMDNDYDTTIDGNGKLIKTIYKTKNMKIAAKCLNIEFAVVNFLNGTYNIDNFCGKMIQGFRFQTNIDSFLLLPERETSVMAIDVNFEPMTFNIGFRQTKAVMTFLPKLSGFLGDMYKEYNDPLKDVENENFEGGNIIRELKNDEEKNLDFMTEEDIEKKEKEDKKLVEKYKIKQALIERKKLKKEEEQKKLMEEKTIKPFCNIDDINYMIDVKVTLDKTCIRFLDDSGLYLIPLLNIEANKTLIKYIQNSNSDCVENISNLILESIARKEVPLEEYDINGLGMYVEMLFNISINFYNDRINDWEPIVERYSGLLKVDQVASFSRMRVYYNSDDIFNMNISISSMSVLNKVLKKFSQDEEEWDKNNQELGDDVAKATSDKMAIQFINLSGMEIYCWLDADEYNKFIENKQDEYKIFTLDQNNTDKKNQKSVRKNYLSSLYQKLPETQLKIKKDKFSFQIKGYVPVRGNDFSCNYTSSFKMKKDLSNKNKIKKNIKKLQSKGPEQIKERNNSKIGKIDIDDSGPILRNPKNELKEKLLEKNEEEENLIVTETRDDKKKEEENLNDEIEILVKIRQNGTLKSIVFESNIFIYNNLLVPISLSLISPTEFEQKFQSTDDKIKHLENSKKILIKSGVKKSIPVKYITDKYRLYVSFHNAKNEADNNYALLYENFSQLKENLNNFIKYNEENSNTFKGEKTVKLDDNYSKLITLNNKNKEFYISSNLIIQRGNTDIIKNYSNRNNSVNEIANNNLDNIMKSKDIYNVTKTFSYLFFLNEALVIENQIPFNLKCEFISPTNQKEVIIRPLKNQKFLDISSSNSQLKLTINYQNKNFISDLHDIKNFKENKKSKENEENLNIIRFYQEGDEEKKKYLEFCVKVEETLNNENMKGAYELEYEHNLESFLKKKLLIFYSRCIIVNKSDYLLFMKEDAVKEKNFNLNNYNGKIYPKSVNLMNTKDIKQAFNLKSENSNWSKKFNINTVGNTGVTTLEIDDPIIKDKVTLLDVGISIPNSWYFINSLLITIEPRFLLVNKFGYDVEYKQYNNKLKKVENDNNRLYDILNIKNNESINLITMKGKKNMKKMIQVKLPGSDFFSGPVDLEEMGDIDVKIPISLEMQKKLEEENKIIEKKIKKLEKQEKLKKQLESGKKKEEKIDEDSDSEEIINTNANVIKKEKKEDKKKELSPEEEKQKKEEEKIKKLKEMEMRPRKYIIFRQNAQSYVMLHILKSAIGGLIYIIIYPPENPQYLIKNETKFDVNLRQKKDEFSEEKFILKQYESIPYAWGDLLKNEKKLIAIVGSNQIELNLNEITINKKIFEIKEHNINVKYSFYFQTIVENNKTRTLIIKNDDKKNIRKGYFLKKLKGQRKTYNNMNFKFNTKGLGLSIISTEPREIFYISFYGCIIEGQMFSYNLDKCDHSMTNIKFALKNIQIDYCLEDNFKSMLIPVTPVTPQSEEIAKKNKETITPFFEGIISFHRATNPLTQISSDDFPQLDFTFQAFKINVSQYQLMSMIELSNEIMPQLDFYLGLPEKSTEFQNLEDLENYQKDVHKKQEIYLPEHYDKTLNTEITTIPEEVIHDSETHWMIFIKNIGIGAMEIVLSSRIDINSLGEFLPGVLNGVLGAIGNIFTHISDFHLNFTSLYYNDVFTDIYSLTTQLTNEYLSQLKRKIFKVIGSLDILGNPTGYASSIGQGFIQLFEAPRKGLINGPLGFGEGVAKGFGTLLTSIVSGTFEAVGKISGTLLASCEVLQGQKAIEQLEDREPDNIFDGLYQGVKEGLLDIGKGIGGIFLKPFEGAKKEGVKGFFKGIGSGILGAVVSPFTATLRIANNLFVGLKNTANMFNPKLKTDRFRYPRTIEKASGLRSYDEDMATIRAILDFLKDYDEHDIVYYKQFTYLYYGYENSTSTLILTNKCIMVVYEARELVFEIQIEDIERVEVHKGLNGVNMSLIFYLKDGGRKFIQSNDLDMCVDFYLMFEKTQK